MYNSLIYDDYNILLNFQGWLKNSGFNKEKFINIIIYKSKLLFYYIISLFKNYIFIVF